MSTADVIREAAKELLFVRGVNGSDGFRQWLYVRPWGPQADYTISAAALQAIDDGIARGLRAAEIVRQAEQAHG